MSERRNVVLVTVDSLRADHCGFLGGDHGITPALDELAAESLVFEHAIAPGPSTYESMPAVFTGELMTHLRGSTADPDGSPDRIDNIRANMSRTTIPEWFDQRGYSTAAFTANPYTGRHTSFARGFDHYQDFLGTQSVDGVLPEGIRNAPVVSEIDNVVSMVRRNRASKPWQSYYDDLLDRVDSLEKPFFLWVFLMEPHTPYLVSADRLSRREQAQMYYHNWKLWLTKKWGVSPEAIRLSREKLQRLYRLAIQSMDDFFRRFLADIESCDPATIVHADHGEAFGEHHLFGHREHLYEENIHVPLLIHNAPETGRVRTPISLTSLPELARGTAQDAIVVPKREYVLSRGLQPSSFAVRGQHWKYIWVDRDAGRTDELYDLRNDSDERDDQSDDHADIVRHCRTILDNRRAHDAEVRAVREAATAFSGDRSVND